MTSKKAIFHHNDAFPSFQTHLYQYSESYCHLAKSVHLIIIYSLAIDYTILLYIYIFFLPIGILIANINNVKNTNLNAPLQWTLERLLLSTFDIQQKPYLADPVIHNNVKTFVPKQLTLLTLHSPCEPTIPRTKVFFLFFPYYKPTTDNLFTCGLSAHLYLKHYLLSTKLTPLSTYYKKT